MRIYMYSKDEAERNHCPKPVVPIVIYALIFVVLLFVTIFAFAFLVVNSVILGLVPWAILIFYAIYGLKFILSQLILSFFRK